MEVDWIIGVFVFIIVIGWAFAYYFAVFQGEGGQFEASAKLDQEKILDYVSAEAYEMPVRLYSEGPASGAVLLAKSFWYSGTKNSTFVSGGAARLPCRIEGDDLFWQADLSGGYDYFTISTADANMSMNCSGSFPVSSYNLTIPWTAAKKSTISLAKVGGMMNASYEEFRRSLGLNRNFRFVMETGGSETVYGKRIPSGPANVRSTKNERALYEIGGKANITIAVW